MNCCDEYEVMPMEDQCFELATAYVPYQQLDKLYPLCEALMKGTLFPELYRPY